MTQHITQEGAVALARKVAASNGDTLKYVPEKETIELLHGLANAAIQYYLDQRAKELPVLPEWSKQDNLGGLVPSEIRMSMRDFGQQCAAHARELALSEAKLVAKTTCHHESTEFANGFNMAALNIESAIEALKGKR